MAQCEGKTRKGERCKRDASGDGAFCAIHQDQQVRARTPRDHEEWDQDAILKAVLGFAVVGVILMLRFRR